MHRRGRCHVVDAALDLVLGVFVGGELLAQLRQVRGDRDRPQQVLAQASHAAEEVADTEKLVGAENGSSASAGDEGADVGQAAEGRVALGLEQATGLSGLASHTHAGVLGSRAAARPAKRAGLARRGI